MPTTFVVVNKPAGLQHFPTTGLTPARQEVFTATVKSPQEPPAPRTASQARHIAASTGLAIIPLSKVCPPLTGKRTPFAGPSQTGVLIQ